MRPHVQPLQQPPRAPPKPPELPEIDEIDEWEAIDGPFSLPCDTLSKITEGSNEAGSEISSVFFSAVSGATSRPSKKSSKFGVGLCGGVPPLLANACRPPAPGKSVAGSLPTPTRAAPRASRLHAIQETPDLRQVVKAFVESAVRGCFAEALCSNGRSRPVIFRLNRRVDAFELSPSEGGASCTVALTELAAAHVGEEPWARRELGELIAGLESSCAVLELMDGRVLVLHFHGCSEDEGQAQAKIFALCMQTFVSELRGQPGPV